MQIPSNTNIQHGGAEYIHKAVRYGGSDKIIEFTDKDTNRKIQFYSDSSVEKSLQRKFGIDYIDTGSIVKATGDFESYLQSMWTYQNIESNTVDINKDGFLDSHEMINSKRKVNIDSTSGNTTLTLASFRDNSGTEEKALESVERYFEKNNIKNSKVSVDEDFNALLYVDKNLDAKLEDMEILANMPREALMEYKGLSLESKSQLFSMLDLWKKKRDEEKGVVHNTQNDVRNISSQSNILDLLLQNNGNLDSLSKKEQSVFLSNKESSTNNRTINTQELLEIKEKLSVSKKYIDTGVNSAKIFKISV